MALAAAQRDLTLVRLDAPEPLVVLGEESSLTSVVTNLLTNALDYSDPGGTVRLSLWRQGDHVVLECADEGLGISEADREQLFTEFFRGTNRAALERPGTGLGLTITRRVVSGTAAGSRWSPSSGWARRSVSSCRWPSRRRRSSSRGDVRRTR